MLLTITKYSGTTYFGTYHNGTPYSRTSYSGMIYSGTTYSGTTYSWMSYSGITYILPKHKKISIRKHNYCILKNFEELLVSQKPIYVGMCLQCVGCRWVGLKAKTKTASNQSKNLTKFSEIKKIRKKRFSRRIFHL